MVKKFINQRGIVVTVNPAYLPDSALAKLKEWKPAKKPDVLKEIKKPTPKRGRKPKE